MKLLRVFLGEGGEQMRSLDRIGLYLNDIASATCKKWVVASESRLSSVIGRRSIISVFHVSKSVDTGETIATTTVNDLIHPYIHNTTRNRSLPKELRRWEQKLSHALLLWTTWRPLEADCLLKAIRSNRALLAVCN